MVQMYAALLAVENLIQADAVTVVLRCKCEITSYCHSCVIYCL